MNEPTSQKQNSQPQAGDPKDKRVRGENSPHLGADKQTLIPDQRQNFQLQLQLDPDGKLRNQAQNSGTKGNSDRLEIGKLNSNSQKSLPSSLMPQLGVLARINGAPANDYLEKVEEGEGTFLNAKEFKYASFFNRLKQGVSQYWRPMDEFLRRDPTGNIYGNKTRVTILSVTLRADGHLKQLAVAQSSGLDFLDHEAELAFQKAEPFLNPPKGLVNAQGDIHFPFGFYLQLEGTQGF
jgi:TonB family protein